jgi:hypothetical protein
VGVLHRSWLKVVGLVSVSDGLTYVQFIRGFIRSTSVYVVTYSTKRRLNALYLGSC